MSKGIKVMKPPFLYILFIALTAFSSAILPEFKPHERAIFNKF